MYGRAIRFAINRNVHQSTVTEVYPSSFFSSRATHAHNKESKFVDDVRKSVSGMAPPTRTSADDRDSNFINDVRRSASGMSVSSATGLNDGFNVVKTPTTPPSSSTYDSNGNVSDTGSYVADTAKKGIVKAMETGLNIGEMAKQTLDNIWDASRDTTHKMKDAVTGDEKDKNNVPSTDLFVNDLRKRAGGYDLKKE